MQDNIQDLKSERRYLNHLLELAEEKDKDLEDIVNDRLNDIRVELFIAGEEE